MSLLSLAGPAQAALPLLRSTAFVAMGIARSLLIAGSLFAVALFFRPLVVGIVQAIALMIKPRRSLAVRRNERRLRGIKTLNRMARDLESSQPGVAAELRSFAARN